MSSAYVPYTPEPYTYLRSSVPNEKTEMVYTWVANELYLFLLQNPLITKTIYETKDKITLTTLVEYFVKKAPYDTDFFHDWTLSGENNGFMQQLRTAYRQIPTKLL